MFDDILGKEKKKIKLKAQICVHCNKFFIGFEGMGIDIKDQPCPHCFKSRDGKRWNKKEMENMKELINEKFIYRK